MIRLATEDDLAALPDIERAAGRCFAEIGMDAVAADEPPAPATLAGHVRRGHAWVHTAERNAPVAYLLLAIVDGCAHVEQVSVHPDHAGRRIGRGLLERAMGWARRHRYPAVTLTTFTAVPWNGPYYRRRGFRYLDRSEETPGLRRIRAQEAAHGLDRWPRACMRRDL
ncbi:GNAT family N-acetyltransferase [Amycolatopsis antarctica]|uniref:GNAT family N-acetyltransferase n=1 Tax=Amycolatopsis antarctica TaxID=1854586 RepID=A0A263D470_9PSEU|nr:GNAT family N-acetyltransferase [Amycolatopsis antarctica]OZM72256.1 GNAT family N-acetyltransferase [Amycolatopsis antarctica]